MHESTLSPGFLCRFDSSIFNRQIGKIDNLTDLIDDNVVNQFFYNYYLESQQGKNLFEISKITISNKTLLLLILNRYLPTGKGF